MLLSGCESPTYAGRTTPLRVSAYGQQVQNKTRPRLHGGACAAFPCKGPRGCRGGVREITARRRRRRADWGQFQTENDRRRQGSGRAQVKLGQSISKWEARFSWEVRFPRPPT